MDKCSERIKLFFSGFSGRYITFYGQVPATLWEDTIVNSESINKVSPGITCTTAYKYLPPVYNGCVVLAGLFEYNNILFSTFSFSPSVIRKKRHSVAGEVHNSILFTNYTFTAEERIFHTCRRDKA